MKKITVNHYLNINLKPYIIGPEKYYKIYFLLRYQNKNTKIKSLLNIEVTESEYSEIITDENNLINKRIKREIVFVEDIIKAIEKINLIFDIKVFNDFWNMATYPIIEKFQKYIQWKFEQFPTNELDVYQRLNIEVYEDTLRLLKIFVIDNPLCISDEIYYGQLHDKQMIKSVRSFLKQKKKITHWEIKKQDYKDIKLGDAINIKYEPKEYDTIQFLIQTLITNGGFYVDYQQCITGSTADSYKYIKNIINSFSDI